MTDSSQPQAAQASWGRRFLELLKAYYWAVVSEDVDDPRLRWEAAKLAYRRVVKVTFPTTVYEGRVGNITVAWATSGQRRQRRWQVHPSAEVPAEIVQLVAQGVDSGGMLQPRGIWAVEPVRDLPAALQVVNHVDHIEWWLGVEQDRLAAEWARVKAAACDEIGSAELGFQLPSHPAADPRMTAVARLDQARIRRVTFEDVVDVAERARPLACVPDDVAFVLRRCLCLLVWGYSEWDFFTVAQHYAGLALESSLRLLYYSSFALPVTLSWRDKDGISVEEVRVNTLDRGWLRYRPSPRGLRLHINGQLADTRKGSLMEWARRHQFVSPEEVRQAKNLFELRDYMSHPDGPHIEWIGRAEQRVLAAAETINGMWARFSHPDAVPWEGDFWSRPRWARGDDGRKSSPRG